MDQPVPSQPPAATSRRDLEARIERIDALIAGARRLIGEGQALDLAVLGFATVDLRDAVRTAPVDATEGLAPRVVALQAAIDGLAADLTAASGAAARGVNAATRRSAFRAYDGNHAASPIETDRGRRIDPVDAPQAPGSRLKADPAGDSA